MPLGLAAATNDLSGLLQKGLFEEEANRNLEAAAQAYSTVSAQFDKDRKLAATAIFRLGEIYRKQGKTNEAAGQYERIVREFADQDTLVTLSRQNIAGLGATQLSNAVANDLKSERTGTVNEGGQLAAQLAALERLKGDPEKQARAVYGMFPDEGLATMLQNLSLLKEQLAKLGPNPIIDDVKSWSFTVGPNGNPVGGFGNVSGFHPQKEIEGQLSLIAKRVDFILGVQKARLQVLQAVAANTPVGEVGKIETPNSATDDEEKEIRRIQEMIKNSPDLINAASGEPRSTPLITAATKGQTRVASFLLDHGADVDLRANASTPLGAAVANGHKAMTELLLSRGANVNSKGEQGKTPLQVAVEKKYSSVIEVLLTNKADVNVQDFFKNTALLTAAASGQTQTVQLLLAAGANPNVENTLGGTPLSSAVRSGSTETVKLLLGAKADPNGGNADRPLLSAIGRGDAASAALLLENGANPNINDGSPLSSAINAKHAPLVEILLQHGADANKRFGNDATPLHFAVELSSAGAVAILLEHKVEVNAQNNMGKTPLDLATAGLSGKIPAGMIVQNGMGDGITDKQKQQEIVDLLTKAGGRANLPQFDRITVSRPSANFSQPVFVKGTNDWNHFTLLDTLLNAYSGTRGTLSPQLPPPVPQLRFPNLHRVLVVRPSRTPGQPSERHVVDLLSPTGEVDCAKDVVLNFGDIVEIPERDHTLQESAVGLTENETKQMQLCRGGKVGLLVRGKRTDLKIWPYPNALIGSVLAQADARSALFSTSDLSHVKVTRPNAASGKQQEWLLDCSGDNNPALWLRDGDVIEVPDKP